MSFLFLLVLLADNVLFVVDASTEAQYTVNISRERLREYIDDIGLFARNMPGVVAIEALGDDVFLYRTRKDIPLTSPMDADFLIKKMVLGDSVTSYRSTDVNAQNWMSCTVTIRGTGPSQTSIGIRLRIRLGRNNPSDVHWLAPIVGADFISERMKEDMDVMLEEFIENSNKELYSKYVASSPSSR